MDDRGNKLSSGNILKNKKNIKLLEPWTLWLKKKEKEKNSEYKRVVITTLKRKKRVYNRVAAIKILMYRSTSGTIPANMPRPENPDSRQRS